eukprot:PhM_4_TR2137/c3_g1_i4/m.54148
MKEIQDVFPKKRGNITSRNNTFILLYRTTLLLYNFGCVGFHDPIASGVRNARNESRGTQRHSIITRSSSSSTPTVLRHAGLNVALTTQTPRHMASPSASDTLRGTPSKLSAFNPTSRNRTRGLCCSQIAVASE